MAMREWIPFHAGARIQCLPTARCSYRRDYARRPDGFAFELCRIYGRPRRTGRLR